MTFMNKDKTELFKMYNQIIKTKKLKDYTPEDHEVIDEYVLLEFGQEQNRMALSGGDLLKSSKKISKLFLAFYKVLEVYKKDSLSLAECHNIINKITTRRLSYNWIWRRMNQMVTYGLVDKRPSVSFNPNKKKKEIRFYSAFEPDTLELYIKLANETLGIHNKIEVMSGVKKQTK